MTKKQYENIEISVWQCDSFDVITASNVVGVASDNGEDDLTWVFME